MFHRQRKLRQIAKLAASAIQDHVGSFLLLINNGEIEAAVSIEIAGGSNADPGGGRSHFRRCREATLAIVVIQSVVVIVEICNEQVESAVVIVIAERHPHASLLTSIFVDRRA